MQHLVGDAIGRKGSLRLLEFALNRIWRAAGRETSPLELLRQSGGLPGDIAHYGDSLVQEFSVADQCQTKNAFLALVDVNPDGTVRPKRTPLEDFELSSIHKYIHALADARLLTLGSDSEGMPCVEVAHESLVRECPIKQSWIQEARADLETLRTVQLWRDEWERVRRSSYLLRGRALSKAMLMLRTEVAVPARVRRSRAVFWAGHSLTPSKCPHRSESW